MSLKKQLALTAIGLVLITLVASASALLWSSAKLQIEEDAVVLATSTAQAGDQMTMQRLVDSLVTTRGVRAVRVVDSNLATMALSADSNAPLTETDRAKLRAAIEDQQPQSYQVGETFRVAAPVVDDAGKAYGAALMSFPADWLHLFVERQLRAAGPFILIVLVAGVALAYGYVTLFMRPVARLDAAVAALGSYRFQSDSLNDLAQRSNEIGRVAKLLQRMANAEHGWRRALEGLRQAKEELEQRVEDRTRELKTALVQQTELNEQLQVAHADLERSVDEMRALAEVSHAINSTRDPKDLLPTILAYAVRLSRSDAGSIYEFNEAEGMFVLRASDGVDPHAERILEARKIGEATIVDRAALHREPTQVADIWEVDRLPDHDVVNEYGYRALLAVPLVKEGNVIGGLVVRRKEPGSFEPETVRLLQTVALQSVMAVGPRSPQTNVRLNPRDDVDCDADPRRLNGTARTAPRQSIGLGEFRKERLRVIRANEGPVELPPTPKVVLHMGHGVDSGTASRFDLVPAIQFLAPLGRQVTADSINFDGVMTCEKTTECVRAYAQGFWAGQVEMVDALLLSVRVDGRRHIPTRALEDSLIRAVDLCRLYYDKLDVPPPYSVGLSLLGIRGYRLAVEDWLWSEMTNHSIERADLIFPETMIEDRAAPSAAICRPIFDMLWNACGFQRCLDYDASGAWNPCS
ncbi:MAG TPA: GAF domain-containing protein [Chloroflexota bacterium]|nr:GAF domain-containing protein [Chloroflexota bacterium]